MLGEFQIYLIKHSSKLYDYKYKIMYFVITFNYRFSAIITSLGHFHKSTYNKELKQ